MKTENKFTAFWNKKLTPGVVVRINDKCIWFPYDDWNKDREEAERLARILVVAEDAIYALEQIVEYHSDAVAPRTGHTLGNTIRFYVPKVFYQK